MVGSAHFQLSEDFLGRPVVPTCMSRPAAAVGEVRTLFRRVFSVQLSRYRRLYSLVAHGGPRPLPPGPATAALDLFFCRLRAGPVTGWPLKPWLSKDSSVDPVLGWLVVWICLVPGLWLALRIYVSPWR